MSNDTFVDSLLSAGVNLPPEISGSPSRVKAITLNFGTGNIIRNSVACGSKGSKLSVGFDWPPGHRPPAVWEFDVGNVAHNNQGPGLRFWNNSKKLHVVTNYIAYRNGGGIENGAYSNTNRYADCLLIDEGYDKQTGISPAWQHHSSSARREDDGGPGRYQRVEAHAHNGAGLEIKGLNLPSETRWEYLQCKFNPSSGRPVVDYQGSGKGNPWIALFKDCDNLRAGRKLNPSDFEWNKINNGTSVYIQTGSSIIEVYHENGQVKQRTLS